MDSTQLLSTWNSSIRLSVQTEGSLHSSMLRHSSTLSGSLDGYQDFSSRSTNFSSESDSQINHWSGTRSSGSSSGQSLLSSSTADLGAASSDATRSYSSRADWTVMVYMSSDTLESFAIEDFQEMAQIGSDANVNIVVQLDRTAGDTARFGNWTDTRRGVVYAGSTPTPYWGAGVGEVDMGNPYTLLDFVSWGMTNYQADNYALVLWGHGDGFEVSIDDLTGNGITASELSSVLAYLPDTVDLVGADACLMGTTEFAYEICNQASVFVGSQELEPGPGWNYTPILRDLVAYPTLNAAQFGSVIVSEYANHYNSAIGNDPYIQETLSAINLSALRSSNSYSLTNALSGFAYTVRTTATSYDLSLLDLYRDNYADDFGPSSEITNYCDIGNLFSSIAVNGVFSDSIQLAAQSVLYAYSNTVISNYSAQSGRATGLSVYMSDRGTSYLQDSYNFEGLSFTTNTWWDELLNWQYW